MAFLCIAASWGRPPVFLKSGVKILISEAGDPGSEVKRFDTFRHHPTAYHVGRWRKMSNKKGRKLSYNLCLFLRVEYTIVIFTLSG